MLVCSQRSCLSNGPCCMTSHKVHPYLQQEAIVPPGHPYALTVCASGSLPTKSTYPTISSGKQSLCLKSGCQLQLHQATTKRNKRFSTVARPQLTSMPIDSQQISTIHVHNQTALKSSTQRCPLLYTLLHAASVLQLHFLCTSGLFFELEYEACGGGTVVSR